jgi:hypothetical protein
MTTPAPIQRAAKAGRDPMLDLWRGLALVDMAWVHLANHPIGMPPLAAAWIGDHTRFAAGALVLLSGLTVGHVFGRALRAGGSRERVAVGRLLRRALLLVVVGRLASIAYEGLDSAMRGFPGDGQRLAADFSALATFDTPGVTGGLLLLYSLLLVAVPFAERFRAAFGTAATMAASLGIFALAQAAGQGAHWPPWVFPLPHWQPLFVAGYLAAPHTSLLHERTTGRARRWRLAVTSAFVLLFAFRMTSMAGVEAWSVALPEFRKVPLNTMELAWYLVATAMVLTWSARLHDRVPAARVPSAWLQRLGSWSLLVYVSHLLLEPPVLMFVEVIEASPWTRASMLVVMAVAMHTVAVLAERVEGAAPLRRAGKSAAAAIRDAIPTAGWVGSGVAAAAFAAVLTLRGALPPAAAPLDAPTETVAGIETDDEKSDGIDDLLSPREDIPDDGGDAPLVNVELELDEAVGPEPFTEFGIEEQPEDPDLLLLEP